MAKNKQKGGVYVILIVILMLLGTPSVFSAVDVQISNEIEAQHIEIVYPKEQIYPENTTITFPFDILDYNSTKLDNSSTSCGFVVVNNIGETQKLGSLIYDSVLNYWYFKDSFNDERHHYNYYVHCDDTNLDIQGFVSSSFETTHDGHIYENDGLIIAQIIFILGLCGLLFWFGTLVESNKEWLQSIKLLTNMVGLFILLTGAGFIARTMYLYNMSSSIVNISNLVYFVLLFTIIPILLIFLVMFIKQLLEFWKSLRTGDDFNE